MLTTPLSGVIAHRLRHAGVRTDDSRRRAQVRASTIGLFPELDPGDDRPCGMCPDATRIAEAVRPLRPLHDASIDQCHVDVASLARRISAICASRPLPSSRVAFVGDDDLASVALLRMNPPKFTLLLDIDERIISAVRREADQLGLADRLATVHVDLSAPQDVDRVLGEFGGSFDVVVTDPPYAHDGMTLFIEVAAALTAFHGEVHAAVPALAAEAWTDELMHAVQAAMLAAGLVLDQIVPGAFTYETSDVVSALLVARRLPTGLPVDSTHDTGSARFYTTREAPHQRPLSTPSMNGRPE